MIVSVLLACEDDAACIRELQRLKRKQRQRIFHRIAAVKDVDALAALRVCNPKRPRSWEFRDKRAFEFNSWLANKAEPLAIQRLNSTAILLRQQCEITAVSPRQLGQG